MTDTVDAPAEEAPVRTHRGNGVGIAAFVFGALGLGPVALILGAMGLARWRDGRASRRSWPLAGFMLGIIGTVSGAALAVLYATSGAADAAEDAHAKVDVINVGNAVVDYYAPQAQAPLPVIGATADGYDVAGVAVPSTMAGTWLPEIHGASAYDWCVSLSYETGAGDREVGYSATAGLVDACPGS